MTPGGLGKKSGEDERKLKTNLYGCVDPHPENAKKCKSSVCKMCARLY